jgi:hypothetical protein
MGQNRKLFVPVPPDQRCKRGRITFEVSIEKPNPSNPESKAQNDPRCHNYLWSGSSYLVYFMFSFLFFYYRLNLVWDQILTLSSFSFLTIVVARVELWFFRLNSMSIITEPTNDWSCNLFFIFSSCKVICIIISLIMEFSVDNVLIMYLKIIK